MAAGPWLIVRPSLLSFACLAAFMLVLDEDRAPWRLVPLQLLWSNVHGFAALGPLLALAFAACHRSRRNLVVALAVAVVACASPLGWHVYGDPFLVVKLPVTEWTRTTPGFVLQYDLPLVVLGLTLVAALVVERPRLFELFVAALAVALAALAVRTLALAAILAAPLVARKLAPALSRARLGAALVALLGVAAAPVIASTPGLPSGRGFDEANLPEGAVRFIAAHKPEGALWNFLPFGGWLAWRLHPDVRVFIDGRSHLLYPADFERRYFAAEHDARVFADFVAQYDLQWAVVRARPGELFAEPIARDPKWTMVYLDDCAAVYVRNDGANRALAATGYSRLRHLTQPPRGPVASNLQEALRHDAALAIAQDPSSLRARAFAAAAGL